MSSSANADGSETSPSPTSPVPVSFSSPVEEKESPSIAALREATEALNKSMAAHAQLAADNRRLHKELAHWTRRLSGRVPSTVPLSSPPKVSSTTHSTFAEVRTPAARGRPSTRLSLPAPGPAVDVYDPLSESDEEVVENAAAEAERTAGSSPLLPRAAPSTTLNEVTVDPKDAAQLRRILSKQKVPAQFKGSEAEIQEVQTWVDNVSNYLGGQFGHLLGRYPEAEWRMILPFFEGGARQWVDSARDAEPNVSWDQLKAKFVYFIRGGRDARQVYIQKMKALTYGKGKCKDLLSLEREFEDLRMKLYPSSSTEPEMNEVVGRWYGDAIQNGDTELYMEVLRLLAGNDQPTLSQWKTAAANAVHLRQVATAGGLRPSGAGGNRNQFRSWHQSRGTPGEKVNELSGDGDDESEADDPGSAQLQQMQDRKGPSRIPGKSGFRLPDEVYQRVMEKRLCLQCYKPGHRISACKEKGQKKRMPTEQELNA